MKYTQDKIACFWQQLALTIDQLLESREEDYFSADILLEQYREQLQGIDRNLTFHFERDDDVEGPVEMVFGCDGYPESISNVLSLIGAAPELSGISFKAFNHRCDPIPETINIDQDSCSIDDFWFAIRVVEQRIMLEIYLQDVPVVLDMDPRIEAVMIYLDALIGEYELMTRVAEMQWLELPASPEDFALRPLRSLREVFDPLKNLVLPIGITIH